MSDYVKTIPDKAPLEPLLTRSQVAAILGVCTATVARDTRLTPVTFNSRRLRYRQIDVDNFIAKHTPNTHRR